MEYDLGFLQRGRQRATRLVACGMGYNQHSDSDALLRLQIQAWAQMEYDLGFLQRADDLRKYSLEEQQEVCVCP